MPKLAFSLLTLTALTLSVAQAQQVAAGNPGAGAYQIDGSTATVSQTINLSIPKRFGLHLHRNSWTLDLTNLQSDGTVPNDGGDANCWRAGDHSSGLNGTGRDTLYTRSGTDRTIPVNASQTDRDNAFINYGIFYGSLFQGDQAADPGNPYSYKGSIRWFDSRVQNGTSKQPIGGYPGFYVNNGKLEWKGPIMCTFQTIVQKFSNSTVGWQFTAQVADNTAATKTFPFALYMSDTFTDELANYGAYFNNPASIWHNPRPGGVALRTNDGAAKRLARGTNIPTGGWLDDNLLEVIVFDGSVAAGNYGGIVTFALSDYAPPQDTNGL